MNEFDKNWNKNEQNWLTMEQKWAEFVKNGKKWTELIETGTKMNRTGLKIPIVYHGKWAELNGLKRLKTAYAVQETDVKCSNGLRGGWFGLKGLNGLRGFNLSTGIFASPLFVVKFTTKKRHFYGKTRISTLQIVFFM